MIKAIGTAFVSAAFLVFLSGCPKKEQPPMPAQPSKVEQPAATQPKSQEPKPEHPESEHPTSEHPEHPK